MREGEALKTDLCAKLDEMKGYVDFIEERSPQIVSEYGNKFKVDWEEGQKTGFFIDQRENRHLLQEYSKGRDVLNMFCYMESYIIRDS